MGYILASQSPRRKELLGYILKDFKVIPSGADETVPRGIKDLKTAEYLSKIKALDISRQYPDDIIIGADTCVILKNEILGKPKDRNDAYNMLLRLSGKKHKVVTGCTVIKNGIITVFSQKTTVKFLKLSKAEIEAYLDTSEPYDKAGSYAIQGNGGAFVECIKGDYFNVVGLPIAKLKKYL